MGYPGACRLLVACMTEPTAEFQLDFLAKLQRIVSEGDFTATYKFALLIALTELAIERGADDCAALVLPVVAIAEKFAELYWKQVVPYSATGAVPGVLSQITGTTAAIPNRLVSFRAETGLHSLAAARLHPQWPRVVRAIAETVRAQPLRYLQNVGGQSVRFIYEVGPGRGEVTIFAGVAFALRRFQGFVVRLAQSGWVRHVRENTRNWPLIGEAGDLEAFMFEQSRQSLAKVRAILAEAQHGLCFYCGERAGQGDVDHFIPWVRYPRDIAENFVLSDGRCNRAKSDMLAAPIHRDRWLQRNRSQTNVIAELSGAGFISDLQAIGAVADWAYADAVRAGAYLWLAHNRHIPA